MKTPKLFTTFVFVSAVLLLGCEKSDELPDTPSPEESDQAGNVNGEIIVPTGSTLDPNTLRVLSATDDNPIVSGVFALEVPGDYTSIYVVNSDDEVVMIGYQYPGKPDNDITPQSTALGILMMSPAALDISGDGKKELVNDILKDPNFPSLLVEVEQSIASGKPLFDTTNVALLNTVGILFQSAAFRLNATQQELPVNMFGSGRNYTFNNSGTAYSTIIGVYKDDEHLEKITVEGLKMVPTSLTELWTGYGGASGSPVDYDYSLVGDGDFTFKFRTGKPGFGDGSPEHDEAFKENLAQFSLSLVLTVLPITPIPGCYLTIKNNVYNTVSAVSGISSNSNVGMGTVLFTVAQLTLNNISSLVECAGAQLRQNWFSSLLQQFNFIQKAFGVLSNGANTTLFGTQWALSESVVDVCFSASGTEVDACGGCDGETTVTEAEGNVYKIVEIGSQCWMAENLNASGGIPQVSDPTVWRDAYSDILGQQPAWCCYENDPANGAVYG